MTVAEIAEVCSVDPTTIGRWAKDASDKMPEISCKMQEARETSKPARFSLPQVLAIVLAGGKPTLAALLEENAAKSLPAPRPRLPNGKQTEYLYRLYHERALSPYQVQLVLGVAQPRKDPLPEVPISPDEAEKFFRELGGVAKNGPAQLEFLGPTP